MRRIRTQRDEDRDYSFSKNFSTYELRIMPDSERRLVLTTVEYVEFKRYIENARAHASKKNNIQETSYNNLI